MLLLTFGVLSLMSRPLLYSAWYGNIGHVFLIRTFLGAQPQRANIALLQANGYFHKALKYNPENGNANLGLGVMMIYIKPELAPAMLEQSVLTRNPPQPAYFWLGQAYNTVGDPESAIEAWREAGASPYFFRLGESAFQQETKEEAIKYFQIVVQIDPDFGPTPYFRLGVLKWGTTEGIVALTNVWRLSPNTVLGYSALGFAALYQNDLESARDYFLMAWSTDPKPSWSYEGLAYVAAGAKVENVDDYRSFFGREPFVKVCVLLSRIWLANGDEERASYWEKCGNDD